MDFSDDDDDEIFEHVDKIVADHQAKKNALVRIQFHSAKFAQIITIPLSPPLVHSSVDRRSSNKPKMSAPSTAIVIHASTAAPNPLLRCPPSPPPLHPHPHHPLQRSSGLPWAEFPMPPHKFDALFLPPPPPPLPHYNNISHFRFRHHSNNNTNKPCETWEILQCNYNIVLVN